MNNHTVVDAPINLAFAGVVPGVEKATTAFKAYQGHESHPSLPPIIPTFLFNKDAFLTMGYAWNQEWSREETDPRRGIWIGGPKGAGKTTLPEQFFARLGVPVVSLTCNRRIPLSDYISKMVPDGEGGWITIPGPLVLAMKSGFPVILNEPSRMDPADLVAMHDIIDRGLLTTDEGEVIRAKRGFIVFATDNTMGHGDLAGAHAGANVMDSATMSRFLKLEVDYPTNEEEVSILAGYFPQEDRAILERYVEFANAIRSPFKQGMSSLTMGTRELIDWVKASRYFEGLRSQGRSPVWFAFERVMGGMPPAEAEATKASFESTFGAQG